MEYLDKLRSAVQRSQSVLCVGLDPNLHLIPDEIKNRFDRPVEIVLQFCEQVIDATHEYCCAYKPNLAFFEALGPLGLQVFEQVISMIPDDKVIIADAKRGDIESTAEQYKIAYFDRFNVDAITLNPMMGFETLDPFINDSTKAIYSLVLTSNPGSNDLLLRRFEGRLTLAEYIASQLHRKMDYSKTHIGMVVGATHPSDLKLILDECPQASLLIPGIGSQGGRVGELYAVLSDHPQLAISSSSRSILYAGSHSNQWKDAVAKSAKKTQKDLKKITKRFV